MPHACECPPLRDLLGPLFIPGIWAGGKALPCPQPKSRPLHELFQVALAAPEEVLELSPSGFVGPGERVVSPSVNGG